MKEIKHLINTALLLSIFTIVYNIIEGVIAIFFGFHDETLALLGFGVDSFVEVFSGLGILNMILISKRNSENRFLNEKSALRITGFSFYILSISLIFTSIVNIYNGHNPLTTKWGIVISIISIAVMWWLIIKKKEVGIALKSDAIIADANCTKVCMQLSIVLLLSSTFYYIFNIGYFDSIGALFIAYFAIKEGKEALQKANNNKVCCK